MNHLSGDDLIAKYVMRIYYLYLCMYDIFRSHFIVDKIKTTNNNG